MSATESQVRQALREIEMASYQWEFRLIPQPPKPQTLAELAWKWIQRVFWAGVTVYLTVDVVALVWRWLA